MMSKKILIIGGTGFISKAVAKACVCSGYIVDILTRGNLLVDYSGLNKHIKCDRRDKKILHLKLNNKSYSYIIDMCAYTDDDVYYILDAINRDCLKKYVLFSSGAVLDCDKMPITDYTQIAKTNDPYINGKLLAENMLRNSSINYIILRPSFVYGANNNFDREQSILRAISKGLKIYVRNLNHIFNLIYVDDVARLTVCFLENHIINESYLLYNPNHITHHEFLRLAEEIVGKTCNLVDRKKDADIIFPFLPMDIFMDSKKFEYASKKFQFYLLKKGLYQVYSNV